MSGPTATYIPDLLEQHYEELQFLWGCRQAALHSPTMTMRGFSALEERIEGHVQGLLVAQDRVIPLLQEGLVGGESATAFAAAYPLLRLDTDKSRSLVLDGFSSAGGTGVEGIGQALCQSPVDAILPGLQALFFSSSLPRTASAAEVLAFHRLLPREARPLQQLLQSEDPALRQSGWRVVGMSGLRVDPKLYSAAMRDEDGAVRRAALLAAAWSALPAALAIGRNSGQVPTTQDMTALELLGILGTAEDWRRIMAIGETRELGPGRFRVLACHGHPAVVELLLAELVNPDPATACAAGAAFTKLTGENIDSKTRTTLPPEDGHEPDEFEAEFLEEVRLPDPDIARQHWDKMKPGFARSTRICRGHDIGQGVTPETLANFDMESRWELFLRSRFRGTWSGSPVTLERFPQRG